MRANCDSRFVANITGNNGFRHLLGTDPSTGSNTVACEYVVVSRAIHPDGYMCGRIHARLRYILSSTAYFFYMLSRYRVSPPRMKNTFRISRYCVFLSEIQQHERQLAEHSVDLYAYVVQFSNLHLLCYMNLICDIYHCRFILFIIPIIKPQHVLWDHTTHAHFHFRSVT